MKVRDKHWIRIRIYIVAALFLAGSGVLGYRAYQLQIRDRDFLETMAKNGYIGSTKLPPARGTIYDREGHELAISVQVASVYTHPQRVTDKARAARDLSRILRIPEHELLTLLKSRRHFEWIARKVSAGVAGKVTELNMEGVGVTPDTRRFFPGREIAAHLIGFVGTDNQGLEGLEWKFDRLLKGPQASLIQMRDGFGRPFAITRPDTSDQRMHDLILTIDKDIQYKVQQVLTEAVKKSRAVSGQCVVMDPYTGEILAMAVAPEFDPNVFADYDASTWRNRVLIDCFEPGSTLKAFLLAASLNECVVTPRTVFDCEQGEYPVGGRVIHDTHKYGTLSVEEIIRLSSNIGAVKIGEKLGYETFTKYLRDFGFGSASAVHRLSGREGFIRPVEEAKTIDRANSYFGQGMDATALQLAVAAAAIANGGKLMRPYVVKKIVDDTGRVVRETHPEMIRRVVSFETARKVARILEGVASEEGTAPKAAIPGFSVAGKTGTSQKIDPATKRYSWKKHVATFVGFAPVDHPRLLILVVIDEPQGVFYGGEVAAPVFRQVGAWSLDHLRVSPQLLMADGRRPPLVVSGDKARAGRVAAVAQALRAEGIPAGSLPDFRGLCMREVLMKAHGLGLEVVPRGSGFAVSQEPRPGVPLKKVGRLTVSFDPPA